MVVSIDPDWMGTPVPYKGGGPALIEELLEKRPEDFSSKKAAESWFMLTHFRNMHFKQNASGQTYPISDTP
jgi:hypothetical protein